MNTTAKPSARPFMRSLIIGLKRLQCQVPASGIMDMRSTPLHAPRSSAPTAAISTQRRYHHINFFLKLYSAWHQVVPRYIIETSACQSMESGVRSGCGHRMDAKAPLLPSAGTTSNEGGTPRERCRQRGRGCSGQEVPLVDSRQGLEQGTRARD